MACLYVAIYFFVKGLLKVQIYIAHTTYDAGICIPICCIMLIFIMQVEANIYYIYIYMYNPMDAMGRIGAFPTENL